MTQLFGEEDENEAQPQIRVNPAYAARLQHNKEREELHRLRVRNPALAAKLEAQDVPDVDMLQSEGAEEGSSSSEETEDSTEGPDDTEFLSALLRIRQGDASIYDPELTLFDKATQQSKAKLRSMVPGRKPRRPLYLKDVIAQQAMAGASEGDRSDDDAERHTAPTHNEEQEELKRSFLLAAEAGRGEDEMSSGAIGGILHTKPQAGGSTAPMAPNQDLLEKVFATGKGDDSDQFLKQFLAQRAWADQDDDDDDAAPIHVLDQAHALDEDEDHLERAAAFEAAYNFRYQEPGGDRITTYSRGVEGLVRKPDERRKAARKRKAERVEQAAQEQQSEVKRLKNLKKAELVSQLTTLQQAAGHHESAALSKVMQGDFDPETYDAAMAAAFGESYYEEEEENHELTSDDIPEEDVLLPTTSHVAEDPGRSVHELKQDRSKVSNLLEDYFKLDYEEKVADVECRFHYREVPPASYGLDVLDVLGFDEKELNQVVGMKKLAPYREDGGMARPNFGKLRELKKQQPGQQTARLLASGSKRRKPNVQPRRAAGADADQMLHVDAQTSTAADPEQDVDNVDHDEQLSQKRLESYAPLTLRRPGNGQAQSMSRTKTRKPSSSRDESGVGSSASASTNMTRAQKKNQRRAEKRKLRSSASA